MSNNLNLPQITSTTADKDDFLDDLFALIDSSVTNSIALDASASVAVPLASIQNYLKIVAQHVPAAGTTLTLPANTRMYILKNDPASLGPVTFACGASTISIPVGKSCVAHMDGTVNGLDLVAQTAGATLAGLLDIDFSTAPTDGQALVYNAAESKWKPGTVAAGSGGGSTASAAIGHQYWRIRWETLESGAHTAGIGMITFKDVNGAAIATTGGTPVFSSDYGNTSFEAPNDPFDGAAPDNAAHSGWYAASGKNVGEWIGYKFTGKVNPYSLQLTPCGDSTGLADAPATFAFEYSDDGQTWTTLKDGIAPPAAWASSVSQNFVVQTAAPAS